MRNTAGDGLAERFEPDFQRQMSPEAIARLHKFRSAAPRDLPGNALELGPLRHANLLALASALSATKTRDLISKAAIASCAIVWSPRSRMRKRPEMRV